MLLFSYVKAESSRGAGTVGSPYLARRLAEDAHGRLWELSYTLDDLAEHDVCGTSDLEIGWAYAKQAGMGSNRQWTVTERTFNHLSLGE
jgi:hypothetical protein